jgi:hypothetical protein
MTGDYLVPGQLPFFLLPDYSLTGTSQGGNRDLTGTL